eukprot:2178310-Prorocentrum_lima.AAC.1
MHGCVDRSACRASPPFGDPPSSMHAPLPLPSLVASLPPSSPPQQDRRSGRVGSWFFAALR